jgi:hypothetical protein
VLLCFDQLCDMLDVDVSVVPTLDYQVSTEFVSDDNGTIGSQESVSAPRSNVLRSATTPPSFLSLPRVALEVEWPDGSTTWGQRAVSYGDADDQSDPLVTTKAHHHSDRAEGGRHAAVLSAQASVVVAAPCRGMPTRIYIWSQTPKAISDASRGGDVAAGNTYSIRVVPSAVVTATLNRRCNIEGIERPSSKLASLPSHHQLRCVLARGSLLTSTLAAAAPHFRHFNRLGNDEDGASQLMDNTVCRRREGWEQVPRPSCSFSDPNIVAGLMMNGWLDNETQAFASPNCADLDEPQRVAVGDIISCIEHLCPALNVTTVWLPSPASTAATNSTSGVVVGTSSFDITGVPSTVATVLIEPSLLPSKYQDSGGDCSATAQVGGVSTLFDDSVLAQHVWGFGEAARESE